LRCSCRLCKHPPQIQLLQTLSILIENIRHQNHIYFLLSNNHINSLITYRFDFEHEELLAYYVSLLKALSLKLNPSTVQFFYNNESRQRGLAASAAASSKGETVPKVQDPEETATSPNNRRTASLSSISHDFPLYTEAIKFFNHKETMIRIAVRTLTLNVYRVEDEDVRRFVLDKTAAPYFSNIVWYIREQCCTLNGMVGDRLAVKAGLTLPSSPGAPPRKPATRPAMQDFMAELQDYFYYLDDIFQLRIDEMSDVLSDQLLKFLVLPQLVGSLSLSANRTLLDDSEVSPDADSDLGEAVVDGEEALSPLVALVLLLQGMFGLLILPSGSSQLLAHQFAVLYIFKHKPLVNRTVTAVVGPRASVQTARARGRLRYSAPIAPVELSAVVASALEHPSSDGVRDPDSPSAAPAAPSARFGFLLACAKGAAGGSRSENQQLQLVGLCLLLTVVRNGGLDHEILRGKCTAVLHSNMSNSLSSLPLSFPTQIVVSSL
jgi:Uncharacterised conserved protein